MSAASPSKVFVLRKGQRALYILRPFVFWSASCVFRPVGLGDALTATPDSERGAEGACLALGVAARLAERCTGDCFSACSSALAVAARARLGGGRWRASLTSSFLERAYRDPRLKRSKVLCNPKLRHSAQARGPIVVSCVQHVFARRAATPIVKILSDCDGPRARPCVRSSVGLSFARGQLARGPAKEPTAESGSGGRRGTSVRGRSFTP